MRFLLTILTLLQISLFAADSCSGITIEFTDAPRCSGGYEISSFDWNTGEGKCIQRQGGGSPVVLNACTVISQPYITMLKTQMKQAADSAKSTSSTQLSNDVTSAVSIPGNPAPMNLTNLLLSAVLIDDNFASSVSKIGTIDIGGTSFAFLTPLFQFYGNTFADFQQYVKTALNIMMGLTAGYLMYAMGLFGVNNQKEQLKNKLQGLAPTLGLAVMFMYMPLASHKTSDGSAGRETLMQMAIETTITKAINGAYTLSVKLNNNYFAYLSQRLNASVDDSAIKQFAAKEAAYNAQKAWIQAAGNVCSTQVNCGDLNRNLDAQPYTCEFCASVNKAMMGVQYMDKVIPQQKTALQASYDALFAAHQQTLSGIKAENKKVAESLGLLQVAYIPSMNVFIENSIANFKPQQTQLNVSGIAQQDSNEIYYQNQVNIEDAYLQASANNSFWSKIQSLWSGGENSSSVSMPTTVERKDDGPSISKQIMGGDSIYLLPIATIAEAAPYMIIPGANGVFEMVNNALKTVPDAAIPYVFDKVFFHASNPFELKTTGAIATSLITHQAGVISTLSGVVSAIPQMEGVGKLIKNVTGTIIEPMRIMTAVALTSQFMKHTIAYLPVILLSVIATTSIIMFIFDVMLYKIVSPFAVLWAFQMGDNGKVRHFLIKGFSLAIWPFSMVFAVLLALVFNTMIDIVFVALLKNMVGTIFNINNIINIGNGGTGNGFGAKLGLIYFLSLVEIVGAICKLFFSSYIVLKTHSHVLELVNIVEGGMMQKMSEQVQAKTENLGAMRL